MEAPNPISMEIWKITYKIAIHNDYAVVEKELTQRRIS